MANQISAGILVYRFKNNVPEFFLVHPGGPFWAKKDEGVWSIPKGLVKGNEDLLSTAKREFSEETGQVIKGTFIELSPVKQKSGKVIHAWAVEGNCDRSRIKSNTFEMEWPPNSGKTAEFPEVDRGEWFTPEEAQRKIHFGQVGFIKELLKKWEHR
jgi:predicted NUDIX family NTP pyrophosphohydrolase